VQELPEYKHVKLDLKISDDRNLNDKSSDTTTGIVNVHLACKDINMMALARDAVEPIVRGRSPVFCPDGFCTLN
jgi:hypothetical protein